MSFRDELKELEEKGVIDPITAQKIETYYKQKAGDKPSRLLTVFAILGVLLIGSGILLMVANNWIYFSRSLKTFLSFAPLIMAQGVGFYVLIFKKYSVAWKESVAIAISFGLIIAMSLMSQIYQMNESSTSILFAWIILSIPLVFLFEAKALGLFLISLSISYLLINFGSSEIKYKYRYLLLFLPLIGFYYWRVRNKKGLFLYFYKWAIIISLLIFAFSFFRSRISLISLAGLFTLFYMWGEYYSDEKAFFKNPFLWVGIMGIIGLYIFSSFSFFWKFHKELFYLKNQRELEIALLSIIVISYLYYFIKTRKQSKQFIVFTYLFPIFILLYLAVYYFYNAYLAANLIVLLIGVRLILTGEKRKRIDVFNIGLLSILILIFTHFLSNDIPFIYRGVAFVLTGILFIALNYYMIKKMRNESEK
jgi:uncharacterized membrane protein